MTLVHPATDPEFTKGSGDPWKFCKKCGYVKLRVLTDKGIEKLIEFMKSPALVN
jgi:hypothetical protein